MFELRQYSDLSRQTKHNTKWYLLFKLFLNDPETLFHIRSNLLCLLCRVLSVSSLLCCVFFTAWERVCSVERHCLSVMTTVTKGERFCELSIESPQENQTRRVCVCVCVCVVCVCVCDWTHNMHAHDITIFTNSHFYSLHTENGCFQKLHFKTHFQKFCIFRPLLSCKWTVKKKLQIVQVLVENSVV